MSNGAPRREGRAETAAPENRHVRILDRRLAHLDARLQKFSGEGPIHGASTYDVQEATALRVALQLFAHYRDEQQGGTYSTAFLLEEAAETLHGGITTVERSELVKQLRDRARLLEELG